MMHELACVKGDLPGTPNMGPPKMVSGTHTMGPISLRIRGMGIVWARGPMIGGP